MTKGVKVLGVSLLVAGWAFLGSAAGTVPHPHAGGGSAETWREVFGPRAIPATEALLPIADGTDGEAAPNTDWAEALPAQGS